MCIHAKATLWSLARHLTDINFYYVYSLHGIQPKHASFDSAGPPSLFFASVRRRIRRWMGHVSASSSHTFIITCGLLKMKINETHIKSSVQRWLAQEVEEEWKLRSEKNDMSNGRSGQNGDSEDGM